MAAILPFFKIGVILDVRSYDISFVLVNCIHWVMGYIYDRKYLLGFSFQIASRHPLVTEFCFLFSEKSALLNIQKEIVKGYHFDSYPVIRIAWYVPAMVEQI